MSDPPAIAVGELALQLPGGCKWLIGQRRDSSQLLFCLTQAYKEAFPHQTNWTHLRHTVSHHFEAQQTPLWWVQEPSGGLVGCIWSGRGIAQATGEAVAYVFLIWVDAQWRRQGIGRKLLKRVEYWAKAEQLSAVELQVVGQNLAAQAFYQKLGFDVAGIWLQRSITQDD